MPIQNQLKNNILIIYLSQRLDASNAATIEAAIDEYCKEPHEALVFDLEGLYYISSAGLRLLLKYKKVHPNFKVVNVASEVYEIFEMTGFTEIMEIQKAFRQISVDHLTVIGRGAKGTVYRSNEDVIKVYNNNRSTIEAIMQERELAKRALILGVETAISYDIVKVGDNFGSIYELLDCHSLSEEITLNPEKLDYYVTVFTNLLKTIHNVDTSNEKIIPSIKEVILKWKDDIKGNVSEATLEKAFKLIEEVPDQKRLLHMDFHSNNVMLQKSEAMLIDMDTLSYGNPIFELASIYSTYIGFTLISEPVVANFLGFNTLIAKKFYNAFVDKYLEGKTKEEKEAINNQIELLGMLRVLRHTCRRKDKIENANEVINICTKCLEDLLTKVDSLAI